MTPRKETVIVALIERLEQALAYYMRNKDDDYVMLYDDEVRDCIKLLEELKGLQ